MQHIALHDDHYFPSQENNKRMMKTGINTQSAKDIDPANWLDQHGDALYAFALMRVREPRQAEDLVQDTLLVAMESIENFKGGSTVRTWLIGILKHKILDHFRRVSREQPLTNEDVASLENVKQFAEDEHWMRPPAEWEIPETSLEKSQFWETMDRCIEKLPEKLRTLYVLREFDGHKTEFLLETLNISSKNNFWVMLSRARLQLRECLEINWFNT